jgi:hypothetical protein
LEREAPGAGLVGLEVAFAEPPVKDVPPRDLVVIRGVLERADDWRRVLRELSPLAQKLLVVVLQNPAPWEWILRWHPDGEDGDPRRTAAVAPVLWELGRVREHAYLALPARVPARLAARLAPLHAFAVDTAPRNPQARRRLTRVA